MTDNVLNSLPRCKKHPDEPLIPNYGRFGGEQVVDSYGCNKCLSETPIRSPIQFKEKRNEQT